MTLAIAPITPAVAALAADLGIVLQPGTVVSAQVLQVLENNLVRIAIASLTFDAATAKPLQQGQTLQLAVAQSANGLTLTPLPPVAPDAQNFTRGAAVIVDEIPLAPRAPNQSAPVAPALTPQETRAVAFAAQVAVTKQTGLSPLFANLSVAVASGNLPPPVLLAAAQLLGLRLPNAKSLVGGDVKVALQSSGLLMEAAIASPATNAPPDIKSALLVLRQTLATWLGQAADASPAPQGKTPIPAQPKAILPTPSEPTEAVPANDVHAKNIEITAAALQASGVVAEDAEPLAGIKNLLVAQLIGSAIRPSVRTEIEQPSPHIALTPVLPPVRGAAPTPQAVAAPTLLPDAEPATIARQLTADTDGALARQTLLQIASLPDRSDAQALRHDPAQPRWNFEIPFITPLGTAMAQFEIARDGGGNETEASQRIWRARFSLDIEPAGPVHALISFSGDTTSVKMWAERPATAAQLRVNAAQLSRSLDHAELKAGDIVVADGAPARAKPPSAGHFMNRAT